MDVQFLEIKQPAEIAAVAELAGAIWREYYSPLIGSQQVAYMLEQFQSPAAIRRHLEEGFRYFFATADGNPQGYVAIVPKPGYLFISKLYVAAAWRGRGIGRKTVDFCEGLAKSQGLARLQLTVYKRNTSSIQAYLRFGFKIQGAVMQDIGQGFIMDDYVMGKVFPID